MSGTADSILLVEDDADDQFFISRAVRQVRPNIALQTVSDGQAAVDFFAELKREKSDRQPRPRLVLLDLNLPRKSGLEVLKWIRATQCRSIVIMVLTSSTSEDDMRQAYADGANAYVLKPADPTKLRELFKLVDDFWFTWNQSPALNV